jgi:hypothetical protein
MEGKVLQQLVGLKPRVVAATGSGIFSGELDALHGVTVCVLSAQRVCQHHKQLAAARYAAARLECSSHKAHSKDSLHATPPNS